MHHPAPAGVALYTFLMSSSKRQPAPKLQALMRKQAFDSVLPAPESG